MTHGFLETFKTCISHAIIDEIVYILLIFLDPSEKPLVPTSRNSQRKHSSKNSLYHSTFSKSCVFKQLPFIIVVESSLSLQVCERCLSSIAHTLLDFGNNYTIRSLRCVYSLALLVCPNISLLLTFSPRLYLDIIYRTSYSSVCFIPAT